MTPGSGKVKLTFRPVRDFLTKRKQKLDMEVKDVSQADE